MFEEDKEQTALRNHYLGIGFAIGMPIGIAFSAIFVFAMKTPGLIGVGAGIGVALGVAIGEGLYQRNKDG